MSRFNVCARKVAATQAKRPSRAFIDFHWCVENLSRLTGEPFTALFKRVGALHGFGREPEDWPDAAQLRAAVESLIEERRLYLKRYRELVHERRLAKRAGQRQRRNEQLDQWEKKRSAHNKAAPRHGYWGWRALRQGEGDPTVRF